MVPGCGCDPCRDTIRREVAQEIIDAIGSLEIDVDDIKTCSPVYVAAFIGRRAILTAKEVGGLC
jgi:hypothetical protein